MEFIHVLSDVLMTGRLVQENGTTCPSSCSKAGQLPSLCLSFPACEIGPLYPPEDLRAEVPRPR